MRRAPDQFLTTVENSGAQRWKRRISASISILRASFCKVRAVISTYDFGNQTGLTNYIHRSFDWPEGRKV